MGLDPVTGKILWQSANKSAGYSTPLPFERDGRKLAIIGSGTAYVAVNPSDGKESWRLRWLTEYGVNASDPWFADHPVEVEWWGGQFASGRLPAESDLAARVQAAHLAAAGPGGAKPEVYGAPYGSDLRLLTGLGGIPTVQYGPGDVRLAHGPHEAVDVADVVTTARTLALLALDICG